MNYKVVSFSHHDLDALGCQLSIDNIFGNKVEYFNTNYKNINEKVDEILCYANINLVKLIICSDISFANEKNNLLHLLDLGIPLVLIDHHLYPDNFFNDLPDNITVIHNTNKCAASLVYEYLNVDNKNLENLIKHIDNFDLWKTKENDFLVGFYLNSYFWNYIINKNSMINIMFDFIDNKYNIHKDFNRFCIKNRDDSINHINKLKDKNLIFNKHKITIMFSDDFYTHYMLDLFKDKEQKCLLVVNTWGSIKVRFNQDSDMLKEDKLKIKTELIGGETGHENAFSYVTSKGFDNIMKEVQKIAQIIERYGHL